MERKNNYYQSAKAVPKHMTAQDRIRIQDAINKLKDKKLNNK